MRIPTVRVISLIGVDAAKETGIGSDLQLMLESMTRQGSVINFNIQFKITIKAIMAQEAYHCCSVIIVLVLCRFHWLGLYQEGTFETTTPPVITCHSQHHCHMIKFALHISIEEGHISFSSAPEDIIFATQRNCRINCVT